MKHVKKVTLAKAQTTDKDTDPFGMMFFQVWLTAFSMMMFGAFGGKDR